MWQQQGYYKNALCSTICNCVQSSDEVHPSLYSVLVHLTTHIPSASYHVDSATYTLLMELSLHVCALA